MSNPDLLEYFFQVMIVVKYDKKTYSQIVSSFLAPYLDKLVVQTQNWHLPPELQDLIDWEVQPVEIDRYFELERVRKFASSPAKQVHQITSSEEIRLSQVRDTAYLVITGGAGAGKSTCLRYLCHRLSIEARDMIASGRTDVQIPVMLSLRNYGPHKLEEMLYIQLRSFNPLITRRDFEVIQESTFIILLLDGIDEIKPAKREDFAKDLELIKQIRSYTILATARKQPDLPPAFDSFPIYEIQRLSNEAIRAFIRAYLENEYSFLRLLEDRNIIELTHTPLLLTLCLITYRKGHEVFDSLAGLYQKIVQLYSENWERSKKSGRADLPIKWEILTASLSFMAQRMVIEDIGYSISQNDLLPLLSEFIDEQRRINRWPQQTVDDLLGQLLAFNLLEAVQDNISFWHPSFRDYFAALKIANIKWEQLTTFVQDKKWAAVTVFLGGLLNNPRDLYQLLSEVSIKGRTPDEALWPINILKITGNDTTPYILKIASELGLISDEQIYLYSLQEILSERDYKGKSIVSSALDLLTSLDQVMSGDIDWKDYDDGFELELVDVNTVNTLFKQTLLAVYEGDLTQALVYQTRLAKYIEDTFESGHRLDDWFTTRNIRNVNDFQAALLSHVFGPSELKDLIRNTVLRSSRPFLQSIIDVSHDAILMREAQLAIVCINLKHD